MTNDPIISCENPWTSGFRVDSGRTMEALTGERPIHREVTTHQVRAAGSLGHRSRGESSLITEINGGSCIDYTGQLGLLTWPRWLNNKPNTKKLESNLQFSWTIYTASVSGRVEFVSIDFKGRGSI